MVNLQGKKIYLRALEPTDLHFLYELENDPTLWEISGTMKPYSKQVLTLYLENAHRDIYEVKQLRLAISDHQHRLLGLIDLFDFDPKNQRAGVGIVVLEEGNRNKGIGAEALQLVCEYAFSILGCHQIYANILEENKRSIHLFKKLGFEFVGNKRDWIHTNGDFKDELLFQKIKN